MPDLNVQSFSRRPETVQAVRLTLENIHDAAEWCGGHLVDDESGPILMPFMIGVGDWLGRCVEGLKVGRFCGLLADEWDRQFDADDTGPILDDELTPVSDEWLRSLGEIPSQDAATYDPVWDEPRPQRHYDAMPVEYRMSAFDMDDDADLSLAFELHVSWRGGDLWAVTRAKHALGADGVRDYEPSPSSREDDWLSSHRFELNEALRLAEAALPGVKVNGKTAADVLAERGGETT